MSPVTWVTPHWVREHLADPDLILLDPRRPMKYMSGHLEGAVNLPVYTAFDEEACLMDPEPLARWAADAGLTNKRTPLLYDSVDGQTGAMLSWVLQYLGCPEVLLMDTFFEGWAKAGGEVFYRPVPSTPAEFSPTPNESIRARWEDVSQASNASLIDFRSELEYLGKDGEEGAGGHVPGAKHLEWRSLVGENNSYLAPDDTLASMLQPIAADSGDVVAYCRTGPRASLGFLALTKLGYTPKLYDGSITDWLRHNGPLETS